MSARRTHNNATRLAHYAGHDCRRDGNGRQSVRERRSVKTWLVLNLRILLYIRESPQGGGGTGTRVVAECNV